MLQKLLEIVYKSKQGMPDKDGIERSILGLFYQVFIDYPDEPLVKLLKSNYFKDM